MKNHEWIDGKLLQTNKKHSHLKQKQKDKIYEWMYAAFREVFQQNDRFPGQRHEQVSLGRRGLA